MESLISVIIPVYNVEQYLDRCIESVTSQTYKNLEIILVDDGSTDNSSVICDKWGIKESRVKVIHKTNGGLSDARNAGLEMSTGAFIGFVDSDDWIAPEMYERLINRIKIDGSEVAACSVQMVWNDDRPVELLTVQTDCLLNRIEAQKALLHETLLKQPVWYKLYSRDTIKDIKFEVGKQHEDVYWSYQVIGNADSVSIIDYIGYFYSQRAESIMGTGYSIRRLDAIKAYENRYQYIAKTFPELEKEALVSIWNNCIYHGQMVLKYLNREESKRALDYLNQTIKRYRLSYKEYSDLKITHRIWIDLARISLKICCSLKNRIGVGL